MALAGISISGGAEVTYTTVNAISNTANNFNSKGFILSLDDATALTTSSIPEGTALDRYIELQSITLNTGGTSGDGVGTFSLVITDTDFKIVGWSTTVSTADTSNYKWEFVAGGDKPVILDSSKDYLFLADTSTSFTLGSTLAATTTQIRYGTNGVTNYGSGKIDFDGSTTNSYSGFQCVMTTAEDGVYTGYTTSFMSKGSDAFAQYAPTISIQTKSIPEPATATLSLLALAGLTARRRRR